MNEFLSEPFYGHALSVWALLTVSVLVMYLVDLFMFGRRSDDSVPVATAVGWTAFWFGIGLAFTGWMYMAEGGGAATDYVTGFIIEKSLSLDNVFVFAIIFSYFAVPNHLRSFILFWGIIGALVMRAIFIFAGVALLERFHWIIYVLGVVLFVTAIRLALQDEDDIDPAKNPALKLLRRTMPMTIAYHAKRFLVREDGRLKATPMFAVFLVVMTTDLIFALDSIPAIFAITTDPFIVVSANAMSLLGMRALYFVLEDAIDRFHYLKYGLALVLMWISAKMLLPLAHVHIPTQLSLVVVVLILIASIAFSLWKTREPDDAGSVTPER